MSAVATITEQRSARLDALRGLALALVLLYHLNLLGVGWVGVQLFFVLSGFLITRQLLELRARRPFGEYLKRFHGRRLLRIFPVYFLYLLVLLACLPLLPASQHEAVATQWPYAASFSYNWRGMTRHHEPTWFLDHFWSLAVEEQFYLVWPLLLYLVPRRGLPYLLAALALAGPLLRWLVHRSWPLTGLADPGALPYAVGVCTLSQLDAFALGGLLCFLAEPLRRLRAPLALLLIALLLTWLAGALVNGWGLAPLVPRGAWFSLGYPNTLPQQGQFLWGYTLINAVSALAVGLAAVRGSGAGGLPGQAWLAGLGRLSYSGYILHFPLAHLSSPAIYRIHEITGAPLLWSTWLFLPLYLSLLLGLCLLIRELYERPLLRLKDRWFPL